jgi:hypothetical protein
MGRSGDDFLDPFAVEKFDIGLSQFHEELFISHFSNAFPAAALFRTDHSKLTPAAFKS